VAEEVTIEGMQKTNLAPIKTTSIEWLQAAAWQTAHIAAAIVIVDVYSSGNGIAGNGAVREG
jgi:hypothetical protein